MSQAPPPPPPPPPPSGNVPVPSGGSTGFAVGDAISYGWNAYWKNVGPMLLITLVIVVVQVVISILGNVSGRAVVSIFFSLIGWVVGMILAMGLIRASLAVVNGRTPEVSMLFETMGLGPYIIASILFGLMMFAGFLVCIGWIFVALAFMFYGFIIVENPTIGAVDALKQASHVTKGRWGEVFVFVLALFGINLIGALLCGVGLLFTYGISAIAVAYAYRTLSGESVAAIS